MSAKGILQEFRLLEFFMCGKKAAWTNSNAGHRGSRSPVHTAKGTPTPYRRHSLHFPVYLNFRLFYDGNFKAKRYFIVWFLSICFSFCYCKSKQNSVQTILRKRPERFINKGLAKNLKLTIFIFETVYTIDLKMVFWNHEVSLSKCLNGLFQLLPI